MVAIACKLELSTDKTSGFSLKGFDWKWSYSPSFELLSASMCTWILTATSSRSKLVVGIAISSLRSVLYTFAMGHQMLSLKFLRPSQYKNFHCSVQQ